MDGISNSSVQDENKMDSSSTTDSKTDKNYSDHWNLGSARDSFDRYVRKKCAHELCQHGSAIPSIAGESLDEYCGESRSLENIIGALNAVSGFSIAECGEPMFSQHLRVDFTPVQGVDDNLQLQKKCSDFWQCVYNEPALRGLVVHPGKDYEEVIAESSSSSSSDRCLEVRTSAINWIKTEVGLDMALAVKHNSKYCNDREGDDMGQTFKQRRVHQRMRTAKKIPGKSDPVLSPPASFHHTRERRLSSLEKTKSSNSIEAAELCSQLEEWDLKHPKCMDPPGRVPPITHAIMQRKIQER